MDNSSQEKIFIDKYKNIDYGSFVKKRQGSIQIDYKVDPKSLGQGNIQFL